MGDWDMGGRAGLWDDLNCQLHCTAIVPNFFDDSSGVQSDTLEPSVLFSGSPELLLLFRSFRCFIIRSVTNLSRA
jgi:hypothetical protein